MVKLNRIYTRTGDGGDSGLVTGDRVRKSSARMVAVGEVDEANAVIGAARLHAADDPALDGMLERIQNDLFDLGADLATPGSAEASGIQALRIVAAQVTRLEREIDALNADLSPLRSFVLPGGSPLASALHLGRTVCRRAERAAVALADEAGDISQPALHYLNRLSDLLFVAARHANDKGAADVLWTPGANREA